MLDLLEVIEADKTDVDEELSPTEVSSRFGALVRSLESSAEPFVECAQGFMRFAMRYEASRAFTEAIGRDPKCGVAYWGRAELLFGNALLAGDDKAVNDIGELALSDYRSAVALGVGPVAALGVAATLLVLNRSAECDCWLRELSMEAESDRSYKIDLLFLHAFGRLLSGNREDAEQSGLEIEMLSGDNSERLFISGVGALLEQRHDAVTNCKEALQYKDGKLADALTILEEKGCSSFVDVSRALL